MKRLALAGILALICTGKAGATPGLGDEIYGATAEAGRTEAEARYHRLGGGPAGGDDVLKLEATHHLNDRLRLAAFGEFAREGGGPRRAEEAGIEAIYTLGRVGGIDVALYGEYALGLNGHDDGLEAKLLLERRRGPFDVRFNLTAEKALVASEPVELSYAAAADYAVGEVRLGVEAFGDLGTFRSFLPRAAHFAGPRAAVEIEGLGPELELSAGYLFALDRVSAQSKGQFRFGIEMEF